MKNTPINKNESASSFNNPAPKGSFISTWSICLALLLTALSANGSMLRLAPEVPTNIFYVETNHQKAPVVGVESSNKVKVLLPGNVKKSVRYKNVIWAKADLPPVGRITVCKTQGASQGQTEISNGFISTMGSTYFTFDVVADRVIKDCYVALILDFEDGSRNKLISFAKLGDLPAGELVEKEVFFPNVLTTRGGSYRFEFFQNGMPIEQFRLNRLSGNPNSSSLMVPWEVRLQCFLENAKRRDMSRPVRPFHRSFTELDLGKIKERGVESFKVTVIVKKDGNVALDKCDSNLSADEKAKLKRDLSKWKFLPAVKSGKPYDRKVAFPVSL